MPVHKINSIQALRAFAVIAVVFVHSFSAHKGVLASFYNLSNWGAIGVDVFFVISGFIMCTVLTSNREGNNANKFMLKRAIRVLPLYWVFTFLIGLIAIKAHAFNLSVLLKSMLLFPFFDKQVINFFIIPQAWTLAYEIYFYAIIYFVLLSALKNQLKIVCGILILAAGVGCFYNAEHSVLRLITSPLLVEFVFGIVICMIVDKIKKIYTNQAVVKALSIMMLFIGIGGMIATIIIKVDKIYLAEYVTSDARIALLRVIIWGVPSAIMVLGIVLTEFVYKYQLPPILISIGNASYSLYLIHFFIIQRVNNHFNSIIALYPDLGILINVTSTVVISLVVYKYIEQPLIKW